MMEEHRGHVKLVKIDGTRKFGFITCDDGEEAFFHPGAMDLSTGIKIDDLQEGDRVEFTRHVSAKGPRATNIRLI